MTIPMRNPLLYGVPVELRSPWLLLINFITQPLWVILGLGIGIGLTARTHKKKFLLIPAALIIIKALGLWIKKYFEGGY